MNQPARSPLIAVVDDDPQQRQLLRAALEEAGYDVAEGADGRAAIALVEEQTLDGMLLDVRMPGLDGLSALKTIASKHSHLPVILLTAYIDVRDAVEAMKTGARDYLEKPIDLDELVTVLDETIGIDRSSPSMSEDEEPSIPRDVVAESPSLKAVFREASRVAPTDVTVLIAGESGTGKEVLAHYLHQHSERSNGPLVAINCASIPEALIESALFGHEKGAFTGAVSRKVGHFEEAQGGTLFLDEIGEMPLSLQPRLLRVLEDRRVRRVGGTEEIEVDVRVIAATHRKLEEEVEAYRFRRDLYYRFNIVALTLPPLRERREDILPLAERFLHSEGFREKRLSPAASRQLVGYGWPGNVRELGNAVVRAAILCRGNLILPEDLPDPIRSRAGEIEETRGGTGTLGDLEKQAILKALEETSGNKTRAAEKLGISRRTLIYRLRSYGM